MRVMALLLVLALGGCSSMMDGDDWRRVIGVLDTDIAPIEVPATIFADQPFTVTISTVGSSTCTRADGATVDGEGNTATVTPWDNIAPEGSVCSRDLRPFPRNVTVTFESAGPATLRIRNRSSTGETAVVEILLEVQSAP